MAVQLQCLEPHLFFIAVAITHLLKTAFLFLKIHKGCWYFCFFILKLLSIKAQDGYQPLLSEDLTHGFEHHLCTRSTSVFIQPPMGMPNHLRLNVPQTGFQGLPQGTPQQGKRCFHRLFKLKPESLDSFHLPSSYVQSISKFFLPCLKILSTLVALCPPQIHVCLHEMALFGNETHASIMSH